MLIKDCMSKGAVCCTPEMDVQAVAALMKKNNVGFLPVLQDSDSRHLMGVITDRDICMKVVAPGYDPRFSVVREVMTPSVAFCRQADPARQALDTMREKHIRRVPVVDARGRLVGVVSIEDLVSGSEISSEKICTALRKIFQASKRISSSPPRRAEARAS